MNPSAPPFFDTTAPWGTYRPQGLHRLLLAISHRLPHFLRRLVFPLRRPIKYGARHPLDVTIWGLNLRLLPKGNTAEIKLLFAPQHFDRDEFKLLASRLHPGGVFVDIGANAGAYSLWAHHCLRGQGVVLAVEPDPEMCRRLRFNLQTNAIGSVRICPVALSDREGEGLLLVNPRQRGENTLESAQAELAGGERQGQPVRLLTLQSLLAQQGLERVDALKIDIEGHELPVLAHFFGGAPASLFPGLVIIEYKHLTHALTNQLFVDHGYRQVLTSRLNLAYVRDGVVG